MARAVAAIGFTIGKGWTGLFEPRDQSPGQGGGEAGEGLRERIRAARKAAYLPGEAGPRENGQ